MHSANWPGFVEREASLRTRNTLALPAHAALYARITSAEQLLVLTAFYAPSDCRFFVLGGGSNLVLTGDFDGLVLHMGLTA